MPSGEGREGEGREGEGREGGGEGGRGDGGVTWSTLANLWLITVPSTNLTLGYDESFIGICSELGERRTRIIILPVKYTVDWENFAVKKISRPRPTTKI